MRHLENLVAADVGSIVAVDRDPEKQAAATAAGATATYIDLTEALAETDPQFGLVCVPNHLHVPIISKLIEEGLDLFVEKPISHTLDGVPNLVNAAEKRGLTSLVGCNLRFHPGIQKLRELVRADAVGFPTTVRIEAGSYLPNWHPEEDHTEIYSARESTGGGAVLDFIHEIDYARWLFGDVRSVTAMLGRNGDLDIETEDTAAIIVEFENGTIGEIHVDYVQRHYSRSCEIIGTDGTIRWDWHEDHVEEYDPKMEAWIRHELPPWEMNDMYADELEYFLNCVESGAKTFCELRDGWADLRVALAAKQAATQTEHIQPDNLN